MRVAIAADHAGFELKNELVGLLKASGHEPMDLGTHSAEPVDYPDQSAAVARCVLDGTADRGIVVCGSGAGAGIAANKFEGILAAPVYDTYTARQCVEHDDVNVLALGARVTGVELAREIVIAFLGARFSGEERHARRLSKLRALDRRGH
ncbi:MAG TPA: ribose 5-phosphate isomerase B [Actinomycetota bacterium]|nr:ribose 5-phosphate isomerase B [Actinomycetota bacterium]